MFCNIEQGRGKCGLPVRYTPTLRPCFTAPFLSLALLNVFATGTPSANKLFPFTLSQTRTRHYLNDLARQESIDVTLEQLEDAFACMDDNKNDVATKAEFTEFVVKVSETLRPILWLVVTSDLRPDLADSDCLCTPHALAPHSVASDTTKEVG